MSGIQRIDPSDFLRGLLIEAALVQQLPGKWNDPSLQRRKLELTSYRWYSVTPDVESLTVLANDEEPAGDLVEIRPSLVGTMPIDGKEIGFESGRKFRIRAAMGWNDEIKAGVFRCELDEEA